MPDKADRNAWNKLRVDLYRLLLPKIQERDQKSGAFGFTLHWNDPDAAWNDGNIQHAWNAIGLDPVIQELFFVIEKMEEQDLTALESLDALVDPIRCPEQYLPDLAASFGYKLSEGISVAQKRIAVQGLIGAFKRRGKFAGFKTFYRLLGFEVIHIYPLWKESINEAGGNYSRKRYLTTPVVGAAIGPIGIQVFTGRIADAPIKPGTLTVTSGGIVIGDDGEGNLRGPSGQTGTVIYSTGDYTLDFGAPAPAAVTASFEMVTREFPFHAARIDIEISLAPLGMVPSPLVDDAFTQDILGRLDEVRPIHVLLRSLAFVIELADTFTPGASDAASCTTVLKDQRDGLAFGTGVDRTYMLDQGSTAEDELQVEFLDVGSGNNVNLHPFDERAPIVCPLDRLVIHTTDGNPDRYE